MMMAMVTVIHDLRFCKVFTRQNFYVNRKRMNGVLSYLKVNENREIK